MDKDKIINQLQGCFISLTNTDDDDNSSKRSEVIKSSDDEVRSKHTKNKKSNPHIVFSKDKTVPTKTITKRPVSAIKAKNITTFQDSKSLDKDIFVDTDTYDKLKSKVQLSNNECVK